MKTHFLIHLSSKTEQRHFHRSREVILSHFLSKSCLLGTKDKFLNVDPIIKSMKRRQAELKQQKEKDVSSFYHNRSLIL